jgi:hypothetical protein
MSRPSSLKAAIFASISSARTVVDADPHRVGVGLVVGGPVQGVGLGDLGVELDRPGGFVDPGALQTGLAAGERHRLADRGNW